MFLFHFLFDFQIVLDFQDNLNQNLNYVF